MRKQSNRERTPPSRSLSVIASPVKRTTPGRLRNSDRSTTRTPLTLQPATQLVPSHGAARPDVERTPMHPHRHDDRRCTQSISTSPQTRKSGNEPCHSWCEAKRLSQRPGLRKRLARRRESEERANVRHHLGELVRVERETDEVRQDGRNDGHCADVRQPLLRAAKG